MRKPVIVADGEDKILLSETKIAGAGEHRGYSVTQGYSPASHQYRAMDIWGKISQATHNNSVKSAAYTIRVIRGVQFQVFLGDGLDVVNGVSGLHNWWQDGENLIRLREQGPISARLH